MLDKYLFIAKDSGTMVGLVFELEFRALVLFYFNRKIRFPIE